MKGLLEKITSRLADFSELKANPSGLLKALYSNIRQIPFRLIRKSENSPATRRSLLEGIKNQESWKIFFDIYSRAILAFAIGKGLNHSDAEDAVSETFVTIMKKMGEFSYDPERGLFRSWLLKTASWRIEDQRRKRKDQVQPRDTTRGGRRTATMDRIPDPASLESTENWKEEMAKDLFSAAVEKIKHHVTADRFQIFDLYVLKEWPAGKVASTLGVSKSQVYQAKHHVLSLIERELKAWSKSRPS